MAIARPVTTPTPPPMLIQTGDQCELELRHHPGPGKAVLLVHGASAQSNTFRIGETETLVGHLLGKRFDVWTLDWRASMRRVRELYCRNRSTNFSIDAAATHDIPAAILAMRQQGVAGKISVVGHCMGGAILAQGIAQGVLRADDVENVVITALGLFYRAAIDNVVKAEDGVLEELLFDRHQDLLHPTRQWTTTVCQQDPDDGDWDRLLQKPYEIWEKTPLPHKPCTVPICHRVSYMFGMPYIPDNIPTIHAGSLPLQFGYIPVQFLLQCCQNLRRGYAAPFVPKGRGRSLASPDTFLNQAAFRDRKVTLITGDLNSLWHRDSIDTMYEWLLRGRPSAQRVEKHVLPGFGHQDLHWGIKAPTVVFPLIVNGL
jgi:pimeloyl-ACP methyl ester carboxylesterase